MRRLTFLVGVVVFFIISSLIHLLPSDKKISPSSSSSSSFQLRSITTPYRSFDVIHHGASLRERIHSFNRALEILRTKAFLLRGGINSQWYFPVDSSNGKFRDVIYNIKDNFLLNLSNHSEVLTLILPWDCTPAARQPKLPKFTSFLRHSDKSCDASNLFLLDYYQWSATEPLCTLIETSDKINNLKYNVVLKFGCNRNISMDVIEHAIPIHRVILNQINANQVRYYWSVPVNGRGIQRTTDDDFYSKAPPFVTYCHVIHDAIVSNIGHVLTSDMKYVLDGCSMDGDPKLPDGAFSFPLYDEIFVITQYWGTENFHRMVEIAPKVVVFIDFLSRHPEIKILAPEPNGGRLGALLRRLGFDPRDRLVTGWVRAKIVYLPRPTTCGVANVLEAQLTSILYRRNITGDTEGKMSHVQRQGAAAATAALTETTRAAATTAAPVKTPVQVGVRDRLILIKRSGSRHFTEQSQIEKYISEAAHNFSLFYELFDDKHIPSLDETMRLFHSAVMVVAPHGAGLTNLFFSQPGTYVIEGVCNPPHINLCFQRLSVVLGHHWHGLVSRQGCESVVDVDAQLVRDTVITYLTGYQKSRLKV